MKYSKKKQGGDKAAGWKNTGNTHKAKYWEEKKPSKWSDEIEFMKTFDLSFE